MTASAATLPKTWATNPRTLHADTHPSQPIKISGAAN